MAFKSFEYSKVLLQLFERICRSAVDDVCDLIIKLKRVNELKTLGGAYLDAAVEEWVNIEIVL
jgi:hypothetical protein